MLRAEEVFGGEAGALANQTHVLAEGEKQPPPGAQPTCSSPRRCATSWGDYVWWDRTASKPASADPRPGRRALAGRRSAARRLGRGDVAGRQEGALPPGVRSRSASTLTHFDPKTRRGDDLGAGRRGRASGAGNRQGAGNDSVCHRHGAEPVFQQRQQGPRRIFLLAALTGNIGKLAGNVGSYAGNYRVALFNGVPQYINENPFDLELDPAKPARPKQYWRAESAHYYNHEDHPLRMGNNHAHRQDATCRRRPSRCGSPTPTRSSATSSGTTTRSSTCCPKIEMIAVQRVVVVDFVRVGGRGLRAWTRWAELKHPDMTRLGHQPVPARSSRARRCRRIFETRGDIECLALVGNKLAQRPATRASPTCGSSSTKGRTDVYLQRILDHSSRPRATTSLDLEEKAKKGVPALMMTRTNPKAVGYEQVYDSRPWYTKTGRLEFYREEDEFIEAGENLPVHREPVDSTFYEPNVIVAPTTMRSSRQGPGELRRQARTISPAKCARGATS